MTIKPVIAQTQKRVSSADTEKKETLGQVVGEQNVHDGHGQSPQRREVFEELSRTHRRSPHKSPRTKRREHHEHPHPHQHHHHKRERERERDRERERERERGEREKLSTNANVSVNVANNVAPKCQSPHSSNLSSHAAGGSNSPAHNNNNTLASLNVGGKSPEHAPGRAPALGCSSPKSQTQAAAVNLLKAIEDTYSGYNSGDEHLQPKEGAITVQEWQRRDEQFAKCMNERGYILKNVEEDGACLFRSISLQIYGDEDMHDVIRQHTMDYIYKNREYFSHFVTEDINSYIKRKRRKDSHGNHIEIQAMSEIYNRPVEVYCYKPTPINIFNSEQLKNGYAPLRLSYQRGSHYNAIIDPYNATVGVGLGLAGYKPDLQTKEAVLLSEQLEIEQTMFEDKLKTTDWEATNEAIEEQIARESYLQWCRDNLQRSRTTTATASSTSATVTSAEALAADAAKASPSKYTLLQQRNSNCSSSSVSANTIACSVGCSTFTAAAYAAGTTGTKPKTTTVTSTAISASQIYEQTLALSTAANAAATTLSSFITNQNELGYASDDTDMSSTSSKSFNSGSGGNSANADNSPAIKQRSKKSKSRNSSNAAGGGLLRSNKKRRCEQQQKEQQQEQKQQQEDKEQQEQQGKQQLEQEQQQQQLEQEQQQQKEEQQQQQQKEEQQQQQQKEEQQQQQEKKQQSEQVQEQEQQNQEIAAVPNINSSDDALKADKSLSTPRNSPTPIASPDMFDNRSNATSPTRLRSRSLSRSITPDYEQQQPCTSKQSNTPEKLQKLQKQQEQQRQNHPTNTAAEAGDDTVSDVDADTATKADAANDVKDANDVKAANDVKDANDETKQKQHEPKTQSSPLHKQQTYSSFYQELLEASYATDGYGQLSESEMLQRAIQMSTQDYIQNQQRKYLFRP